MKDLEQSPDFNELNICAPDRLCHFNKLRVFFKEKPKMMMSVLTQKAREQTNNFDCWEKVHALLLTSDIHPPLVFSFNECIYS